MCKFFRGMTIVAIVVALTGCHGGGLKIGGLSFPVKAGYEIVGSTYDKSFQMAYRAIEESNLEIYNSNKDNGQIYARTNRSADSVSNDPRAFTTNFTEFKFHLKEIKPGKLVFDIQAKSNSGGQIYLDQFIENYSEYIKFTEVNETNADSKPIITEIRAGNKPLSSANESQPTALDSSSKNPSFSIKTESQPVISEIRTEYQPLAKQHEFSKQEIIEIQNFLKKLGYDPGPVDGEMNSTTMDAIKKFKVENKAVMKLF